MLPADCELLLVVARRSASATRRTSQPRHTGSVRAGCLGAVRAGVPSFESSELRRPAAGCSALDAQGFPTGKFELVGQGGDGRREGRQAERPGAQPPPDKELTYA